MERKAVESQTASNRKGGILVHPTSFPGPFGIGDLGPAAYRFIDFMVAAKQSLWQVLPIGPTGYGDSPYQSFSSFAGQPLIISPEILKDMGLLSDKDIEPRGFSETKVDFGPVIIYKFELLRIAFHNFLDRKDEDLLNEFHSFIKEQEEWLNDYSLFMAVKDYHGGLMWCEWEREIAFPTDLVKGKWKDKLEKEVMYYSFIQFVFFKQWFALKKYANERGIKIIGDVPIFTALDSSDVWANKELFYLDEKGYPTLVAGVPPDYFSETGQLWGNPLYDWEKHKETGYKWWIKRVGLTLKMVDYLRIDHFRGFEAFWAIPYGSPNAIIGEWKEGPYEDLFYALENSLGKNMPIIAEDLGVITPKVINLRDKFNLPGMKILQFAFDNVEENPFLPHNYVPNTVCYTGTHDNDTSLGWYLKADVKSQEKVRNYMNSDGRDISWDFIRSCYSSVSDMAIIPLQDVLSLDSEARMNTPGTTMNNWAWRYRDSMLTEELSKKLYDVSLLYGRVHS